MVDIFGADTRLSKLERTVAEAVIRNNEVLYPSFVDGDVHIHTYKSNEFFRNKYTQNSALSFLKGGLIIPFDFVNIAQKDFVMPFKKGVSGVDYEISYLKFLSRPDFFYVDFSDGNAHVFPIDVKTRFREKNPERDISQISMYNTAMLYFHSNYMQNIVEYLKGSLGLNVIFENGFFLFGEKRNSGRVFLDSYIRNNLPNCVKKRDADEGYLGIRIEDGKPVLNLDLQEDSFITSLDYSFSTIAEAKLINHFGFIKNRLNDFTIYPNFVYSINGFNGGRKPICRLDYDPSSHVRTFNPVVDVIEDEIEDIAGMSPQDIFKLSFDLSASSDERKLNRLRAYLESKEYVREGLVERKFIFNQSTKGSVKERARRNKWYLDNFNSLERSIFETRSMIQNLEESVYTRRELNYETRVKPGSPEWNLESLRLRNFLIHKRRSELQYLKKKSVEWEKEDDDNTEKLFNFNLRCAESGKFNLATSPILPAPTELYMQFKSEMIAKVLLFNAYDLDE